MLKIFRGIILVLSLFAVFAAGQAFAVFPNPKVIFWATIAIIVLLFSGYFFGMYHPNGNTKESDKEEK